MFQKQIPAAFKIHALTPTEQAVVIASRENSDSMIVPRLHLIMEGEGPTALEDCTSYTGNGRVYTVMGPDVGDDASFLPAGLYISNNQKMIRP